MKHPKRLLNKNFLLLWQGQTVSLVGTQISTIAMLFWLKHATESPVVMGSMQMITGLVAVLLGPVGGAFADRYSRRSIIIICDVISGVVMISLAALLWLYPGSMTLSLIGIFTVSIGLASIGSFFGPAISASIPDLAPHDKVTGANSMLQSTMQLAGLLGQGIGGVLFRLLGAPMVFFIDGWTYLFSAFTECFMKIPQHIPDKEGDWKNQISQFKDEILEGLRYIRQNRGLLQLVLLSTFVSFFISPIIGLLTFYVEDHLKLTPDWFGYLLMIYGLGNVVGFLVAGTVKLSGKLRSQAILSCFIIEAIVYGLLGLVLTPVPVASLAFIAGNTTGFVSVHIMTILQVSTPGEIRGRVFGLLATISGCITPLGMGLGGVIASVTGKNIPLIYVICGCCILILTLWGASSHLLREFLAYEEPAEDELLEEGLLPVSQPPIIAMAKNLPRK